MKNLSNLVKFSFVGFKGIKPLKLKVSKYDPNEIIEIQEDYRRVRGLPPERMTRSEYDKRMKKETMQQRRELKKFLERKEYLEKRYSKSSIRFPAHIQ